METFSSRPPSQKQEKPMIILAQTPKFSFFPKYPPQFLKSLIPPLLLLHFLLLFAIPPTIFAAGQTQSPQIPYSEHCNDFVPESSPSLTPLTDPVKLRLFNAHFKYASEISQNASSEFDPLKVLSFRSQRAYKTQKDGVIKLDGTVYIRGFRDPGNSTRRGLRLVHYRPPRIPVGPSGYDGSYHDFYLSGFWDSTSGKLCMVGSGNKRLSSLRSVMKLNYPNKSNLFNSLINGTLEILNGDGKFLDALNILGANLRNYEYELIEKEIEKNVFQGFDDLSRVSLGLEAGEKVCQVIRKAGSFNLEYKTDCKDVNCDFLGGIRGNLTLPGGVIFNEIECWESGLVRYLLGFQGPSLNGLQRSFETNTTIVAEGKWDGEKKRLDMVGCRILDGEGTVGDCSVRLSLRLPAVYTMQHRSGIVGEMWSNRSLNESGFFGRVALWSSRNRPMRLTGVRYEYTEVENVKRSCARKMKHEGKGGRYPDGTSRDLKFDMVVRNKKGEEVSGHSSPLFVGENFSFENMMFRQIDSTNQVTHSQSGLVNVSYDLSFRPPHGLNLSADLPRFSSVIISAEGVYDSKSGHLCMVGCMGVALPSVRLGRNLSPDCEILVQLQYPPLDAKVRTSVKGTIESTRNKSDALYFEAFEIASYNLYTNQAKESLWRMDLEITMVLISNTLACIFVGLQLFYVKKHPSMLPFISVMMLTVLTLAHMIPLLLNFEALFFSNHNRQNVYHLGSSGWLEVNEVLVRVITMVAFLLEFRLLQLTWSAKVNDETQKVLWISEKKVLYLCLPLYIGGGLIAWFCYLSSNPRGRTLLMVEDTFQQSSFWGDLKSYAGLILDGFLLPQIMFNLFSDAKERALGTSFSVGTTFVRLLPHIYDLYRAHNSAIKSIRYIYANPKMDYYSTAWDIIICIVGLLLVTLLCLQQRFGARFFLHKRFRHSSTYEKVPVVSGTE